jgi:hypothetical protein
VYNSRVQLPTVDVVSKFWMMGRNIEPLSSFPVSRQNPGKIQASLSIDLSEAAGGALDCGVSAGFNPKCALHVPHAQRTNQLKLDQHG